VQLFFINQNSNGSVVRNETENVNTFNNNT